MTRSWSNCKKDKEAKQCGSNKKTTSLFAEGRIFVVYGVIPTRKMKLNSKRFCLGDLIPFDFS